MDSPLAESQLQHLATALHRGADQASQAMATWLSAPSLIEIDSVDQLPIGEAVEALGDAEQALCICSLEMQGALTGQIILAFDDPSGLSLTDLLLERPAGTATEWGDVEQSAALETTNILGSAYLNALSQHFSEVCGTTRELLPSPPTFRREFVASVLQAAFHGQAATSDFIFVAKATFQLRGEMLNWTMLFVPDAISLDHLRAWTAHTL